MDIYWKITLSTLIIGCMTTFVGAIFDCILGYQSRLGQVAFCGMGVVSLGLVEAALLSIRGIW